MKLIWYPKCGTCRKAKAFLDQRGAVYETRHIKEENPTMEELRGWQAASGLPLKKFFNTSGQLYRELKLSERLSSMGEEEQLMLLAGEGMLVKRPILVGDGFVLVGFKQEEWERALRT